MPTPLAALLAGAGIDPGGAGASAAEVGRVVHDSRRAAPGCLFVAIPGEHTDGHRFAREAAAAGAVAVVAERIPDPPVPATVPLVIVPSARAALAPLAAAACGHPSRRLWVAGVTGTDGKTTTTTMLHAAWQASGLIAGAVTTVDFRTGSRVEPNSTRQTTPEASDLQERLRLLVDSGCTHAAIETSSHALALHRVDCVDFDAAVFTRVTSEHLDFHGSLDAYLASKARLLEEVSSRPDGVGVLDADDGFAFPVLRRIPVARRLTYSVSGRAGTDLCARRVDAGARGVQVEASTPWGDVEMSLRVSGRFNAANALAALAAACAAGSPVEAAAAGISALEGVTGRMERVDLGQGFAVVIDYAHTAEGLAAALRELRVTTTGRLLAVFGSAGERDRVKRPEMGRVAAEAADAAILTDEDPRGEDRVTILEAIAEGARAGGLRDGDTLFLEPDRGRAIDLAVSLARPGDTVLLAGKGHEESILSGGASIAWDERGVAEAAIRRRLTRDGEPR